MSTQGLVRLQRRDVLRTFLDGSNLLDQTRGENAMLARHVFAALLLAAAASGAVAADATIGTASIKLPTPAGFCDLKDHDPSDKRMLTVLTDIIAKSGNKLLAMSADCRQLTDWRAGKRSLLDDLGQYQTPTALMDKPSVEPVKQTCATLRAEGDKLLSNQLPDIKARVESALEKVKLNNTTFLGVLAEEPTACYAALLQKIRTEAGTDKTQVTAFATTIIKNKSVFVYRIGLYANSASVDAVLAKLKLNVAALVAANRN
jgi:hypothetical protein